MDDSLLIERRIHELQSSNRQLLADIENCKQHMAAGEVVSHMWWKLPGGVLRAG